MLQLFLKNVYLRVFFSRHSDRPQSNVGIASKLFALHITVINVVYYDFSVAAHNRLVSLFISNGMLQLATGQKVSLLP